MEWAREHPLVVFTHDLGFSTILGTTNSNGPSVIQLRGDDVLPAAISTKVVQVILRFEREIDQGAIVVLDEARSRVRLLPLRPAAD